MSTESDLPKFSVGDHEAFMTYALEQAKNSPPAQNKFCVGAALVDADKGQVLSTGYSLEFPRDYKGDKGTTHAEQCCFIKIADKHDIPWQEIGSVLPQNTVLYTTMEPCSERLSGNTTCTERIIKLRDAIKAVYIGITEPDTFIKDNIGQKLLADAGVRVECPVEHMRDEILKVSMAGH